MSISKVSSDSVSIIMSFLDNKSKTSLVSTSSSLKSLSKGTGITLKINGDNDLERKLEEITDYWVIEKLDCCNLTDILPLSSITGLHSLDITLCELTNISVLSSLTGLRDLGFDKCIIDDISALETLTDLKKLEFFDCPISDISAMSGLTSLRELGFYNCIDITEIEVSILRLPNCNIIHD